MKYFFRRTPLWATLFLAAFSCTYHVEPTIEGRWVASTYRVENCLNPTVNLAELAVPCCSYYIFEGSAWLFEGQGITVTGTYTVSGNSLRIVFSDGSNVLNRTILLTSSTLSIEDHATVATTLS